MPHELFSKLSASRVDHEELLSVLTFHFGLSQADPTGGVMYPEESNLRMRVRVANDRITDIQPGPNFDAVEADKLAALVDENLVKNQGRAIHTRVAFASLPVTGFFRAPDDAFQILPAPPEAPRPPALIGDHPFLVQYAVVTSPDWGITGQRSSRALAEWVWFMNGTLNGHISTIGPRTRQVWGICPDWSKAYPMPEPKWCSEGYFIPGWTYPSDTDFSPAGETPLPIRDADEYYDRRGISVGATFDLPSSFSGDIRRFLALDQDRRGRFLRAAQWRAASDDLWEQHISSWYIAQVAVIETLAHGDELPDLCTECGRDKNQRPTARFKDFLDRYAPGSGSRTEYDKLYEVRSGLVHGGTLLHHDSPFGAGLLAFATNEREPMDRLSQAVKLAMVNWLRGQASGN